MANTDSDLKKFIGQRLQLLRIEKKMTQEQMSECLHLSTSAYCKIEYGDTDITLSRLNKIANILEIPVTELFQKLEGNCSFNNNKECSFVGIAKDHSTIQVEQNDTLKQLIQANSKLIELLCKRIDHLEEKLNEHIKS